MFRLFRSANYPKLFAIFSTSFACLIFSTTAFAYCEREFEASYAFENHTVTSREYYRDGAESDAQLHVLGNGSWGYYELQGKLPPRPSDPVAAYRLWAGIEENERQKGAEDQWGTHAHSLLIGCIARHHADTIESERNRNNNNSSPTPKPSVAYDNSDKDRPVAIPEKVQKIKILDSIDAGKVKVSKIKIPENFNSDEAKVREKVHEIEDPEKKDPKVKKQKLHNPAKSAMACVKVEYYREPNKYQVSENRRFVNGCGEPVEIFWCYVNQRDPTAYGDCAKAGQGNSWTVKKGYPILGGGDISWGACRGANSGGFKEGSNGRLIICPDFDPKESKPFSMPSDSTGKD